MTCGKMCACYICPAGQPLNYGGRVYRNRAFNYIGTRKKCGPCSLRPQCTSAAFRGLGKRHAETPRCHRSCRPPPSPAPALAIGRSDRAYLARPPSPDSFGRLWLARLRSRRCGCPPDSCRSIPAARGFTRLRTVTVELRRVLEDKPVTGPSALVRSAVEIAVRVRSQTGVRCDSGACAELHNHIAGPATRS
jgi:hypothetical protein